jgi:hypothetical protein
MAVSLVSTGVTFPDNSTQTTAATGFGFKNRIINGAMVIDQRNAGAEVNPAVANTYYLDRWKILSTATGKFKIGQNAGTVTPPAGFTNYLGCTSLSAYSVGASDFFGVRQIIEGFNFADFGWGTSNAQPITISFWVRSSLTGTFGIGLINNGANRAYAATYTINSANTWEQKSVTIAGDTTGTWLTTTDGGLLLTFGMGYGSSLSGTANVWNAGTAFMATGATSVVGTSGATFYITGVQLEKGSTATSFDYRPYGTELALCQRYFQSYNGDGAALKVVMPYQSAATTGELDAYMVLPVPMRSAPSAAISNLTAYDGVNAASSLTSITLYLNTSSIFGCYFASSGLTIYRPYMVRTAIGTTGYLQLSAEL